MSNTPGVLLGVALLGALALAALGTAARLVRWMRTPQRRQVVLTPAPRDRAGVALRVAGELTLFTSLWRATRIGWLLGWTFHAALLVVLIDHLWLVVDPVPAVLWRLHALSVPVAGVLLAAIAGLALRRACSARLRLVSTPSDYLHLALLAAIVASGLALRSAAPVDIGAVRAFVRGLLGPGLGRAARRAGAAGARRRRRRAHRRVPVQQAAARPGRAVQPDPGRPGSRSASALSRRTAPFVGRHRPSVDTPVNGSSSPGGSRSTAHGSCYVQTHPRPTSRRPICARCARCAGARSCAWRPASSAASSASPRSGSCCSATSRSSAAPAAPGPLAPASRS